MIMLLDLEVITSRHLSLGAIKRQAVFFFFPIKSAQHNNLYKSTLRKTKRENKTRQDRGSERDLKYLPIGD